MKSALFVSLCLVFSFAQANSSSNLFRVECRGQNSKYQAVSFRIQQDQSGVNKGSLLADVRKKSQPGHLQLPRNPNLQLDWMDVEGCMDVSLVGMKGRIVSRSLNGDIALSCEVNGRYGLVLLSKRRDGRYEGSISSDYGISALAIAPGESVAVECQSL